LPLADQFELIRALDALAEARDRAGRRGDALDLWREALKRMDQVDEHLRGLSIPDVDDFHAHAGTRLARALADAPGGAEADAKALALLDDAVTRLQGLVDRTDEVRHYRAALAAALAARARARERAGQVEPAGADAETARARLESLPPTPGGGPAHPDLLAEVY